MLTVQLNVTDLHGGCSTPRIYNLARHYIAGDDFLYIPLYKQAKKSTTYQAKDLIKWQEN